MFVAICVGGVQNMCIYMCNVHPHVYNIILIYMYIPVFSVSIQSTILYPLL